MNTKIIKMLIVSVILTSVFFLNSAKAQKTDTIKQSDYVCSDDLKKQVFGKVGCAQYAAETEKSISESVAIYVYAFMKRMPLVFSVENFCKMKSTDGKQFVLRKAVCSFPDLNTGNKNILGESCGRGFCRFDDSGMAAGSCDIEDHLDHGALIPIALSHLDRTVKKIHAGKFELTNKCESNYKQLDMARKELDALEGQFMTKYQLPMEKISSANLNKVCFSQESGAVSAWASSAKLNEEVSQALCTLVMAEKYIAVFMNNLHQCEMFNGIQKDYSEYLFKGTKTLDMLLVQLESVCTAVETANTPDGADDDDEDGSDVPSITAQQCYDNGTGFDGKSRNNRIKDFFNSKYPFDLKYFQILKKPDSNLDKNIIQLPLCAGMLAGLFARRKKSRIRSKTRFNVKIPLLVFSLLFLLASNSSYAKKAKWLWRPTGAAENYTFTCAGGAQVTLTRALIAADPTIAATKFTGTEFTLGQVLTGMDSADYMWNMTEQYFYIRRKFDKHCDKTPGRRFFKLRKMKKGIAKKCKIRRSHIKTALKSLWKARKDGCQYDSAEIVRQGSEHYVKTIAIQSGQLAADKTAADKAKSDYDAAVITGDSNAIFLAQEALTKADDKYNESFQVAVEDTLKNVSEQARLYPFLMKGKYEWKTTPTVSGDNSGYGQLNYESTECDSGKNCNRNKRARERAGERLRAEAAQACVNLMNDFAKYTKKNASSTSTNMIQAAEATYAEVFTQVETIVKTNNLFCSVKSDDPPPPPPGNSAAGEGFNSTMADARGLAGIEATVPGDSKGLARITSAATAGTKNLMKPYNPKDRAGGFKDPLATKFGGGGMPGGSGGGGGGVNMMGSLGSDPNKTDSAVMGATKDEKDALKFESAKGGDGTRGAGGSAKGISFDFGGGSKNTGGTGVGGVSFGDQASGDLESYLKQDPNMTLFQRVNRRYAKKSDFVE